MSHSSDTSDQLKRLTDKRLALESLIKITVSIQTQQASLQELSVIAKPSQDFPAKLVKHIDQLSQGLGDLPIAELIQRLDTIELVMAKSLNKILLLAKLEVSELTANQLTSLSIDDFVDAIANFKRRTQTAVALRYLLNDRGVTIPSFSLAIPQESIVEYIETLKDKEKRYVKQIRKEIVSIVKDSDKMIIDSSLTDSMKKEILNVRQAMQVNLEHLDSGGSVRDIPNVFETIVLESQNVDSIFLQPEKREPLSTSEGAVAEEPDKAKKTLSAQQLVLDVGQESFFNLLKKWLSSPWNVSWRSIKKAKSKKK